MGPLTDTSQVPVAENLRGIALLPPDTPQAMSAQTLRPFKQPSRVVIVQGLPQSANGKVAKGRLRALARSATLGLDTP